MATNTYVALDTQTLTSAASSVTFSSISGAYTDLVIVTNFALTNNNVYAHYVQVNGDTGNNYSRTVLYGTGTVAGSARQATVNSCYFGTWNDDMDTTDRAFTTIFFNNYSNATTYKTIMGRWNVASKETGAGVGTWRNTAAITSIKIETNSTTYIAGSTFTLYGILAEGGAKATGGYVTSDANYYYHTFLASGTFTPISTLSCDVLVVAGGGGGGGTGPGGGGGGGAGGFKTSTALSVSTATTVTVGAGGAGGVGASNQAGFVGNNSIFSSITSTGGGYGGGNATHEGGPGGSGGGGGGGNSGTAPGGAASPSGQGNTGGNGQIGSPKSGGGGGGAGAVGTNASGSVAGAGGNGTSNSYSGSAVTYAGGGGGGSTGGTPAAGGTGGGGAAVSNSNGTAGTANLGGGGGAGDYQSGLDKNGGAGGSGVVIVRYAKV